MMPVKTLCRNEKGFTLAEIVIAMLVSGIVLLAAVTLASALSSANTAVSELGNSQAVYRQVMVRLTDLLRHSNRLIGYTGTVITLWRDTDGDGVIDAGEMITIDKGLTGTSLTINGTEKYEYYDLSKKLKIQNVQFYLDPAPPWTRFINISFEMKDNGVTNKFYVGAKLRGS